MAEETKEIKISKIRKRDGRIVEFAPEKITNAIFNAAKSVAMKEGKEVDKKTAEELCSKVITILEYKFTEQEVPTVEEVQDIVEKVLIKSGHAKTAKAYILYRQQHAKLREAKDMLVDVGKTIRSYIYQEDWKVRENSNEDYSFSGLLLYAAGKVIGNYALNEIYTPDIKEAHVKGYFHLHDLSNAVIGYCSGWSLQKLLKKGFGGVKNKVDAKPAKHMGVVVHQMVNFIGCLQMEFAGAQAFSSTDTLLAPFIRADNMSYKEIRQCMQELVYSLNIPSRWGSQFPFSNLTFDWTVPEDLKNEPAIVGGNRQSFTYGDCQKEMDMLNKSFLEVMLEGDARGRIFTFPIPTYNLTKDFDWDSENAKLLFRVTAKYGLPYFQNYIGSNLNPKSIRAMCCRLQLDQLQLIKRPGNMWGPGDNTGSIGVVTINMNRLGYESKGDKSKFFELLSHYMRLAKDSLEIKRRIIENNLKQGLMPYARVYLGSFRNHFSTIGLCGMNECCLNFMGRDIGSKEGTEFTIETLKFMRERLIEFQEETGNLYNLEATPAESTSYRLARLDKKMYPDIITAGKNEPYLTNSTQLPVNKTDDVIEALEHQNKIQPLYTGGTIFHTFLGERLSSWESCRELVKKIASNTQLSYFSITPTFSICPEHGYLNGEVPKCLNCGAETEVYSRIVGYFRPIRQWNNGKREEFKDRLEYSEEKALGKKLRVKAVAGDDIEGGGNRGNLPRGDEIENIVRGDDITIRDNTAGDEKNNSGLREDRVREDRVREDGITEEEIEGEGMIAAETKGLINSNGVIKRFRLFSLPNCDKCAAAKEYLRGRINGEMVDLGSNEGLKEFRKTYRELKDRIHRKEDGSLPIPTMLFYDGSGKLITVAHHVDEVKQIFE